MKYLIFDSGPIISLTLAGHLNLIEKLKSNFNGEFILTPQVKREVIERPMKIKKYSLEAIKVNDLLDRGILKLSSKFVPDNSLEKETKNVLQIANGILRSSQSNEKIKIIHEGEASCLAFSRLCGSKNVIVVDERTTRLLTEAPINLKSLMEKKLHIALNLDISLSNKLGQFRFIRSPEILFISYKKGLIHLKKNKKVLDALLYSLKFKGAAISSAEIEEMKNRSFE